MPPPPIQLPWSPKGSPTGSPKGSPKADVRKAARKLTSAQRSWSPTSLGRAASFHSSSPTKKWTANESATACLERRAELEKLDTLKSRVRSSSYGLGGADWHAVFRKYDTDGSGELDLKEFVAALHSVAISAGLHDSDLEMMFGTVDEDGSGLVDAEEFAHFMEWKPDELARKKNRDANGQGTAEYICMARCLMREGESRRSAKLGMLARGEVVAVSDDRKGRLRVSRLNHPGKDQPIAGWVSQSIPAVFDDASGEEVEAERTLMAKLDRSEGQMGRYATEREEAEGTQRRLVMLAQDIKWANTADQETAAANRKRRRAKAAVRRQTGAAADTSQSGGGGARISLRPAPRPLSAEASAGTAVSSGSGGGGSYGEQVPMTEAEHRLYGEMAAAALAECDVGVTPLAGAAGTAAAGDGMAVAQAQALRSLLLSLLEHTPRWRWGRAIEREWPVLRRELRTLLAVTRKRNRTAT